MLSCHSRVPGFAFSDWIEFEANNPKGISTTNKKQHAFRTLMRNGGSADLDSAENIRGAFFLVEKLLIWKRQSSWIAVECQQIRRSRGPHSNARWEGHVVQ